MIPLHISSTVLLAQWLERWSYEEFDQQPYSIAHRFEPPATPPDFVRSNGFPQLQKPLSSFQTKASFLGLLLMCSPVLNEPGNPEVEWRFLALTSQLPLTHFGTKSYSPARN
eukprot:5725397-Amphidinium_carterae.1